MVGCKNFPPPTIERCTAYGELSELEGQLFCVEDDDEYERLTEQGDICTNGDDYESMFNYCMDIRKKLIECEQ